MRNLIVFDIDRTIYDGSIFLDFSLHLIQKDLISPKFLSLVGFEYVTYQTGFESYDELVRDCLNYFFDEVKNIPPQTLKLEMRECLFKNHHKFFDFVFEILRDYPEYNYMLISLEPEIVTKEVANFLKIENFACNHFLNQKNFLAKPNLIFNKLTLFKNSKFGNEVPFAVFGDSESDLELLKLSENRFIINPTSTLQKIVMNEKLNYKFSDQISVKEEIKSIFN